MSSRAALEAELGELKKMRKQRRVGFEDDLKVCTSVQELASNVLEESNAAEEFQYNAVAEESKAGDICERSSKIGHGDCDSGMHSELARLRSENEELRARLQLQAQSHASQQCRVKQLEEELGMEQKKFADMEAKLEVAYNEIAASEQDRRDAVAAAEEARRRAEYAERMLSNAELKQAKLEKERGVYETAARKAAGEIVSLKLASSAPGLRTRSPSSHSSPRIDTGRSFDSDLTTAPSMTPPAVPCVPCVEGGYSVLPPSLRDESAYYSDNTSSAAQTPTRAAAPRHPFSPEEVMRAAVELAAAAQTKTEGTVGSQ